MLQGGIVYHKKRPVHQLTNLALMLEDLELSEEHDVWT
jgi:hypothetical protein